MLLMIDNYDSFTYNLVQYLGELGEQVRTVRNDAVTIDEIEALEPARIVISPGPGVPDEAGISLDAIRHFAGKVPILGVCLGHQAIGRFFGGEVVRARRVMHGKADEVVVRRVYACRTGRRDLARQLARVEQHLVDASTHRHAHAESFIVDEIGFRRQADELDGVAAK